MNKVEKILISQPQPLNSPYTDIINKYGVQIDFNQFFKVEPVSIREFRAQKVNIPDFTAVVFSAKSTIDAFFAICEQLRYEVPETMKYFCTTEAIALYLQKHIVYRKRKIFYGDGTIQSIVTAIGTKHKDENFLLALADSSKTSLHRLFVKSKLKHSSAVFIKTLYADLKALNLKNYDLLVFYSPADVRSLYESYPEFVQGDTRIITFGPSTAKEAKSAKLATLINAPTPECPSVSKALEMYLEQERA